MSATDQATTGRRAGILVVGLLVIAAPGLTGCDAGSEAGAGADRGSGPAMEPVAGSGPAGLMALDPWVRVAIRPEGSGAPDAPPVNSAAYLVVRNAGAADDAIVAVETEVADTAELHTVSMEDGVARMRAVDSVPVAAGGDAVLEPGGFHIMLIGIRRPLAEGDSVSLLLRLRSGDSVPVMAPVLPSPPRM